MYSILPLCCGVTAANCVHVQLTCLGCLLSGLFGNFALFFMLVQLNYNRPSGSKPIWQDPLHKKFVTDITPLTSRHSAQGIAGDLVCNGDLLQIFCKTKAANVGTFMQRDKA